MDGWPESLDCNPCADLFETQVPVGHRLVHAHVRSLGMGIGVTVKPGSSVEAGSHARPSLRSEAVCSKVCLVLVFTGPPGK